MEFARNGEAESTHRCQRMEYCELKEERPITADLPIHDNLLVDAETSRQSIENLMELDSPFSRRNHLEYEDEESSTITGQESLAGRSGYKSVIYFPDFAWRQFRVILLIGTVAAGPWRQGSEATYNSSVLCSPE